MSLGDLDNAPLGEPERAMLDYVRLLTLSPALAAESNIQALRQAGFDDAAIGDIVLITAMYAMMNRLVDGIGETLPPDLAREAAQLGLARHGITGGS